MARPKNTHAEKRPPRANKNPAEGKHLTVEDLAEREGVPVQTVYQWNRTRTGPRYLRVGRYIRYRFADVIAWEDSRYADGEAV